MLVVDERDAPLAVEVHRELAGLERLRRRELVAEPGLEADELVVAVPVDESSSATSPTAAQAGSLPISEWPFESTHLPPKCWIQRSGVFS